MVEQNYILYVNAKRILRTAKVDLNADSSNHILKFSIPEKHLICGLIVKGIPIKSDRLKDFPFKPIEKYLFEFSNIHFIIPDNEFTVENTDYHLEINSLEGILSVLVPLTSIDIYSLVKSWDSSTLYGLTFRVVNEVVGLYDVQVNYVDGSSHIYPNAISDCPADFDFAFSSEKDPISLFFIQNGQRTKDYFFGGFVGR